MKSLAKVIPTNLIEEKEKFFSDPEYNPQFVYGDNIKKSDLQKYGLPDNATQKLAEKIVSKAYKGRNESDLELIQGNKLTQEETTKKILLFLKIHRLEKRFDLSWSRTYIPRTSITTDTIKLRLPAAYRKESLMGMIYHEIGTHALRRINYEQQPWFRRKNKHDFSSYLETEEGLASLHTLLPKTYSAAHTSALLYLLVSWAQELSFTATYKKLSKYIQNPEKKWRLTYRVKRGMMDTSQPGGYTKDLLYFRGMIKVWQWLADNSFDPTKLYIGKCSLEDLNKAWEMNPDFEPTLPSFFTQQPEKYTKQIQEIGRENWLESILL